MTCSIERCTRQRNARGWCKLHYERWRVYGSPLYEVRAFYGRVSSESLEAKLARKSVDAPNGCSRMACEQGRIRIRPARRAGPGDV